MDSQPYVNGYLHSNGRLTVGASCIAPIVECTNRLSEALQVSWINLTFFGDDAVQQEALTGRFENSISVASGQLALVTNLYPSAGMYRSLVKLESATTGTDYYFFKFSDQVGYYLDRVPKVLKAEAPVTGSFSKELVQGGSFAPRFSGSPCPKWKECVIFPVSVFSTRARESVHRLTTPLDELTPEDAMRLTSDGQLIVPPGETCS
jgi:hypothetical protein